LMKGVPLQTVALFTQSGNYGPTVLTASESNITLTPQEIATMEAKFQDNSGAYIPNVTIHIPSLPQESTTTATPEVPSKTTIETSPSENPFFSFAEEFFQKNLRHSNCWVLNGSMTNTGLPFLVSDPHVSLTAPSIFYLIHLQSPTTNVIGAALTGSPGIFLGRSENIAFGFTLNAADTADLYVLNENSDGLSYIFQGKSIAYSNRTEVIHVKSQPDIVMNIKESVYGPVVNDVFYVTNQPPIALKWIGAETNDGSIGAFITASKATSFWEFKASFDTFVSPSLNIVYADINNNIGYFTIGSIPIRKTGQSGRFPVSGDGTYNWESIVTTIDLPCLLNPVNRGYLVTANNRVTPPGYPINMNPNYYNTYRALRITEMIVSLSFSSKAGLNDMIQMQQDVHSSVFDRLKPSFSLLNVAANYQNYLQMLLNWDGNDSMSSTEATIFESWLFDMTKSVSQYWNPGYFIDAEFYLSIINGTTSSPYTCKGIAAVPTAANCQDFASKIFENVVDNLLQRFGGYIPTWGALHTSVYTNKQLKAGPLACFSSPSLKTPGGFETVFEGALIDHSVQNATYKNAFGPNYRHIVDLHAMENSLYVITPGNSGDLMSANYDNLMGLWGAGQYLPMKMSGYNEAQTLILTP